MAADHEQKNGKKTVKAEVAAHMSFDIIRYSQLWEDSELLNYALNVQPKDRVLSISSAGCNALSLLLRKPEAVIALDLNPVQNAILALKLAAIQKLQHQEFVELIGLSPSSKRLSYLDRLDDPRWLALAPQWNDHRLHIERGLPSQGRLDQFLAQFAREHTAKLKGIEEFRSCFLKADLAKQKRLATIFMEPAFKATFIHTYSQEMLEKGRDPAQFRYVEQGQLGRHFYERFITSINERSLFGNPYIYFFLYGEPLDFRLGYDYAKPENFEELRALHDRVHVHTAPLEQLLDHSDCARVDKANLSNIFEYMSQDNMNEILLRLSQRMPKGGRVAFWNLLVDRGLTEALKGHFKKVDLGPQGVDRIFFYKAFHVLEKIS